MTRTVLTASDPQPPVGTCVRDAFGREWMRVEGTYADTTYWLRTDNADDDAESWVKVAGNYGPVEVTLAVD